MKWFQQLLKAGVAGGLLIAAPFAASMAADGFSMGEARALLAQFVSGAIGGMAGLFVNKPRDPDKRERAED